MVDPIYLFDVCAVCTAISPDLLVLFVEVVDALLLVGDGLLPLSNLFLVPLLRYRWAGPNTKKALGYNSVLLYCFDWIITLRLRRRQAPIQHLRLHQFLSRCFDWYGPHIPQTGANTKLHALTHYLVPLLRLLRLRLSADVH